MIAVRLPTQVVSEQWLSWLENRGRTEQTVRTWTFILRYFRKWLDSTGMALDEVRPGDVEQWIADMRVAGLSLGTIRSRVTVGRGLYRWLLRQKLVEVNPFDGLGPIRAPRPLPEVLDESEILRVIDAAINERETAILETIYSTGCRRDELLHIRIVKDLNLAGGFVRLIGKGRKERIAPLGVKAVAAIQAWLVVREKMQAAGRRNDDELFVSRQGPLKRSRLQRIMEAIGKRSGLGKRVYSHILRHSCATHMLDRGANLKAIQTQLGHASLATTGIYLHVSTAEMRRVHKLTHPRATSPATAGTSDPFPPPPICPGCGHAGHWRRCTWTAHAPSPQEACACEISPPEIRKRDDGGQMKLFPESTMGSIRLEK